MLLARMSTPLSHIGVRSTQKLNFILVPGAGGSAWYWHLVVPKLVRHGYEAVPVALPASDDSAGLPEYADAVVDAIADRDPARGMNRGIPQ